MRYLHTMHIYIAPELNLLRNLISFQGERRTMHYANEAVEGPNIKTVSDVAVRKCMPATKNAVSWC